MAARVSQAGIGGKLVVVRDGEVLVDESYGGVGDDTPLSVASTAKWVTASTVLTLVDEGLLTLDDPISTWLPDLEGPVRDATLRQLLSHTSGVKQQQCIFDPGDELASCTQRLLAAPLEFEPGVLEFLEQCHIVPGATGTVSATAPDGTVTLQIDDRTFGVGAFAADRILVAA